MALPVTDDAEVPRRSYLVHIAVALYLAIWALGRGGHLHNHRGTDCAWLGRYTNPRLRTTIRSALDTYHARAESAVREAR